MTSVQVPDHPPLEVGACRVIAEAGVNHSNSVSRAITLAECASAAGAWAIKFQLYTADTLSVPRSPKYWTDTSATRTQYEAFRLSARLDYPAYRAVAEACRDLKLIFFATPFDLNALHALEAMSAPLFKIASGDLTHEPLIRAVAETGKPVLLSTGAATVDEIERAIEWSGLGPDKLVLLVCTLAYPTADEDGNFARIESFRTRFAPYLVGVSDHTLGSAGGWMTAALGGVCVEKHYTLDTSLRDVPDHRISVDPQGLAQLVAACNRGAILRGSSDIRVRDAEVAARVGARRSIVVERDIPAGTLLSLADIAFKRPGTGLPPSAIGMVVGRRATTSLRRGHIIAVSDLSPPARSHTLGA